MGVWDFLGLLGACCLACYGGFRVRPWGACVVGLGAWLRLVLNWEFAADLFGFGVAVGLLH